MNLLQRSFAERGTDDHKRGDQSTAQGKRAQRTLIRDCGRRKRSVVCVRGAGGGATKQRLSFRRGPRVRGREQSTDCGASFRRTAGARRWRLFESGARDAQSKRGGKGARGGVEADELVRGRFGDGDVGAKK